MIRGIIVYDRKDAEYNSWFIEHIIEEGLKEELDIELKLTEDILVSKRDCIDNGEGPEYSVNENIYDFAIMRNRNYHMSEYFEQIGIRCFNSSYVCKLGNDKWEMYRDFSSSNIPVMYTQTTKLPYPFVYKPKDGHGGENVYLIKNATEYEDTLKKVRESSEGSSAKEFIYQMVASEKGRDIRVYVVGDTILTAMERRAEDSHQDFRANFSLGGSATEHALTEEELKVAAKVADHIKADFIGIDLIYNSGKPIVNEIEDAVGTRMLYAETDIDAVKEYISWIKKVMCSGCNKDEI